MTSVLRTSGPLRTLWMGCRPEPAHAVTGLAPALRPGPCWYLPARGWPRPSPKWLRAPHCPAWASAVPSPRPLSCALVTVQAGYLYGVGNHHALVPAPPSSTSLLSTGIAASLANARNLWA